MSDDLVTAAVFGDLTQVTLARNLLADEGIPASIANENLVGGLYMVAAAVGAFKLQVPASRLEESLRLLDQRLPVGDDQDVGEPEDPADPDRPIVAAAPEESEPTDDRTLREQRAEPLFRGAVIGIFLWPVMLFVFWRFLQVVTSDEQLRPKYRRRVAYASWIVLPHFLAYFLLILMICVGLVGSLR